MADIAVKEVDVLRAYTNKLGDFKTGCITVGALMDRQIRKIKDDLEEKFNDVKDCQNVAQERADEVISRYDRALSHCETARPYIGDTDKECKYKLQEVEDLVAQIKQQIEQLKLELENAGQHTKNFSLQTINMVEGCQSHMNNTIEH